MILDTNYLSAWWREKISGQTGPAHRFAANHRSEAMRTTIICAGELAVALTSPWKVWDSLRLWKIYPLHAGIVLSAATVDRQLICSGQRLGENDNWIAGFALYYREPLVSKDADFDRVEGLRRVDWSEA